MTQQNNPLRCHAIGLLGLVLKPDPMLLYHLLARTGELYKTMDDLHLPEFFQYGEIGLLIAEKKGI